VLEPPSWGFLATTDAVLDAESAPDVRIVDVPGLAAGSGRRYPADVLTMLQLPPDERGDLLADLADSDVSAAAVPLGGVDVLAPIPQPRRNVFAVGANYRDHVEESVHSAAAPAQPIFFSKATTTVIGPGPVEVDPRLSARVDWEVELALVIGAVSRNLSADDALDAVFGYLPANDLSARDQQHDRPEGQWFLGKSLDGFCPMGPWLVTADEVPDPQAVEIRLDVNGVRKQQATTKSMIFSVADLLVELSRFITLLPGDILLTGTPSGVGDARTPPEYLADGDVVVAEAAGLGRLETHIVHRTRP
jgi:2-keto-4-pentenoate hydratase/2-oxohepta-3-ene-1,7-dioic acid hydratase in catechol pathway